MNDEYYPEEFVDFDALEEFEEKEKEYQDKTGDDIDELLTMKLPDLRKYLFKS